MRDEELLKQAYAAGFESEKRYHGCAQCTIAALYEIFPELRNDDIFRAAGGLGAGVGMTCQGHCGGLSGAVMVLSQVYGRELKEIDDPEKKRYVAFRLGRSLVQKFLDQYGTVTCQEIHRKLMGRGFDLWDPEDKASFEKKGAHDNICPSVIGNAVRWAAQLILEKRRTPPP
jgi:C_GCAxxG_C_C family probable redox protein